MFTQIEPNHRNTQEFLRYVIKEIIEQQSLRPGKSAEVLISENSTPFPKIIQISGEEGYEAMKKLDFSGAQIPSSYSFGMQDLNGRKIAFDDNTLKYYRMEIIVSYLQEKLSGMCVLKNEPVSIDGSSSFVSLIDVLDLDKLKQEANELGIDAVKEHATSNDKEVINPIVKSGTIPTICIKDNKLKWGTQFVPIGRGQKKIIELLLGSATIFRENKLSKRGEAINRNVFQQFYGGKEMSFRNALKNLRSKIDKAKFPMKIKSDMTNHYILEIHYPKSNSRN